MTDKQSKKYRARSKAVPEWYVKERTGNFGTIGNLDEALIQTEEWWKQHLCTGWEDFFDLEEVEEEGESST